MSKEELIKLLRIRSATLIRLETNQKVCHTVLNKLANFFDCQPQDLFEKEKE
ncbi:helix-turn-helix domain-containing protein [bacterium]|nr:helix-turn-helix domain-containing protein [bacterium]